MNDITCMLWKSPRQNTLKIPINFECDSLKQKSDNGTTNKQQNKTNKQRIILPFQTGKNRFVPNLLRAKKTQRSANYESIKMYISRQMWLAYSIFAPDHTPSLHIFASYLPQPNLVHFFSFNARYCRTHMYAKKTFLRLWNCQILNLDFFLFNGVYLFQTPRK